MIPNFIQSPDLVSHTVLWKPIMGLCLVLFATFVGVEVRIGNEDEDN